ncbi:MAG: hypothetical protein SPL13_01590, partial [Clostridia bacterium]|nr:hypothetical protein [Clostridia bacterium]
RTSQNYSEGTAYFDDLDFETIEENDLPSINPDYTKNLEYGSEKYSIKQIASDGVFEYLYDMTLNTPSGYFNPVNNLSSTTVTQKYTGNRETSLDKFPADSSFGTLSFPDSSSIALADITFASVSLTIQDSANFVLAPESYLIITFDITNGLSTSGSTLITVLVYDEELTETSAFTTSDTEEVVHGGITIINNDPDNDKSFYLVIVIGPTDVSATSSKYSFASGNVEINNISAAEGLTYQYVRDNDPTSPTYGETIYPTEETENRKYYDLLSSTYQNVNIDEYSKDAEDTYYLAASKTYGDNGTSNLTTIRIAPVAAENYRGVSYNSNYVKADGTDNAINARTGKSGDGNGNYAGLINSRFDYSTLTDSINVNDNLNYSGEKSIQPLMIYNSTADSYGFIGKSFSIVANANATISVKVKAVGNAKAYVYLVDTADKDKSVFTMDFTGNVKNNSYGEKFTAQLAFTGITESSMDANGWKTLTFYIANGATAHDLRLELWNGSRDGEEKSEGFVFFAFDAFGNDEKFTPSTLSSAFTEPTSAVSAFATSGNPLYDNAINNGDTTLRDNALQYKRELDATEIKYNSENPDNAVSYDPNYVWAKSDNVIYSVFNTIDPVAIDPYDNTDEDTGSGCTAQTDPSTFWLSFSSILLAAVLVLAIIMLVVKNVRRRRKANKSDAKSHYNVTSRNKSKKKDQKVKKTTKQPEYVGYEDEPSKDEQVKDDVQEEVQEQTENNEEYVYGDVQDFGSDVNSDVNNDENKNNEQ